MDVKELIAEARAVANWFEQPPPPGPLPNVSGSWPQLLHRLADALEQATPPEGWYVKAIQKQGGGSVELLDDGNWGAFQRGADCIAVRDTAREAMAALEATDSKTPASG